MFLIPYQSYKLIQLLTERSKYTTDRFVRGDKQPKHIVIMGHIASDRMIHIFRELFHKEQYYRNIRVVILAESEPEPSVEKLLWHPFYKTRIVYLVGTASDKKNLHRVALEDARACFILTDQYPKDKRGTDNSK